MALTGNGGLAPRSRAPFAEDNQALLFQASIPAYDVVLLAMRAHRTHEALQYAACGVLKVMAVRGTAAVAVPTTAFGQPAYASPRSLCVVPVRLPPPTPPTTSDAHVPTLVKDPYLAHTALLAAIRAHRESERVNVEGLGALVNLSYNGTSPPGR